MSFVKTTGKAKAKEFVADLPTTVRNGDRVKLRDGKRRQYTEACKLAGYVDFHPDKVHVVTRQDTGQGGVKRLWVGEQPFMFAAGDVVLAWNSEPERRAGLAAWAKAHP